MKKGEIFERLNPYTGKIERLTYTGTFREVKYVMYYFFETEDGRTVFFLPSEVKEFAAIVGS